MASKNMLSLNKLMNNGEVFEVDATTEDVPDKDNEDENYERALLEFTNLNCLDLQKDEEGSYSKDEPFEALELQMENLDSTGEIKKRILRKGYGPNVEESSIVRIHYNAYIEYEAVPFDSTYARKRPMEFTVDQGHVIEGLDIAVKSMQLNEKAQFILKPTMAYGPLGCLGRIPANSTVLFEIELIEIVDANAAGSSFLHLPREKQKEFAEVYKYCLELCARGKLLYQTNIRDAIADYNNAVNRLEYAVLNDETDEKKQQHLLMRLYTNLVICYAKIKLPKKGCYNFNKINNLMKGMYSFKLPAKVYYQHAMCLKMLDEYDRAIRSLNVAYKIEPLAYFEEEIRNLVEEKREYFRKQSEIGRAMFNSSK